MLCICGTFYNLDTHHQVRQFIDIACQAWYVLVCISCDKTNVTKYA